MATVNTLEQKRKPPVVVIQPSRGWVGLKLKDLWLYRELVYFLTWRDIKVRYKQSVLGILWAILKPFMAMVVFTIFFGNFAKIPSDGVPYPIFSYTATLPWELFAAALGVASRSMVSNSNMVSKIYFPRMIIPLASVMSSVVDFFIGFTILIGMMIFYKVTPTIATLWLPLLILLALITALGVGFWSSALMVRYRDVGYIMPFIANLWMYLTPVVYPSSMIPEKWRLLYALNPMTGVVEGFRYALLGTTQSVSGGMILVSSLIAIAVLISGMFYFRRMEKQFADMI
ncbi:MAG TPA: ABC transporter permease [Anaerolineaceae bacterium]|jgi:lipopolysaccharide transport system permease protein|nr:ABC transporter permease [Anaerolineaceae bacterium]HOS52979.1 ABC transporter permease [Anaerolineaceae bacterium]HPD62571.1 ABC transporter permease [Anaerolineaceae bacterium]HQF69549.1 ABC transporter permease [Anaerolineaceae bacterium]HRS74091.1 ABC transporter permease [Anaerolineaceae bacterium]